MSWTDEATTRNFTRGRYNRTSLSLYGRRDHKFCATMECFRLEGREEEKKAEINGKVNDSVTSERSAHPRIQVFVATVDDITVSSI